MLQVNQMSREEAGMAHAVRRRSDRLFLATTHCYLKNGTTQMTPDGMPQCEHVSASCQKQGIVKVHKYVNNARGKCLASHNTGRDHHLNVVHDKKLTHKKDV